MISLGRHLAKIYTVKTEDGYVIQGGNYCLDEAMLDRHILLQGIPRAGKTNLLKAIIRQLLQKRIPVVVVDGAGSPEFVKDVCVMASEAGLPPVDVIRYPSEDGESASFDGFIGGHQAIYNRLVALMALEDFRTDGDHYREAKRNILAHVAGLNMHLEYAEVDPIDPPVSFDDLLNRLSKEWWTKTFGRSPRAMEEWKTNESHARSLHTGISTTIRPFRHLLGTDGIRLGQSPLVMVSISEAEGGYSAQALFRYFGEAFSDVMKTMGKTVWVIDEIGAFGSRNVAKYTKVGRQYGLGLVMAYQSTASLGDDQYSKEVLDTTGTHILMRSNESLEMRSRAGFTEAQDRRHTYYDNGKSESVGSRRVEKILHDDVNSLPTGQMFVIIGGDVSKVRGEKVELRTPFHKSMEAVYKRRPPTQSDPPTTGGNPERSPF